MPLFIAALWGALIQILGTVVGTVLVSLGIGYATFTGVDVALTWAKVEFVSRVSALPAAAVGVMATMHVGTCVSMLMSALLMRLTIAGLSSGTMKRMVIK
jgi:hypothetical protein